MLKREYPRLGETYYEQTLPNGLTVRVLPRQDFSKVFAMLAVNYGSVDTAFSCNGRHYRTPDGVAHYLEHKMFDLPEGDAMEQFSRLGANPNAFTSYAMTAYHFQTSENAEECLKLGLRMVLTPCFTQASVEKERGIIAQEIRMYADSPDSQVYERLFANMLRNHPCRVPISGSLESIQQITEQTLQLCYDAFYRPSNMILVVKGNMEPETVLRLAEQAAADTCYAPAVTDYGAPEPLTCALAETVRQMDVSMPTFQLAFRCPDVSKGDATAEIAGDLAAELLMGESSALYQRLYDAGLIDAGFSAGYESIRGLAMISVGGDSRDPYAVRDAIWQEAERMCREGFAQEDFLRLKKSAVGRRIRDLDGFDGTCYRLAAYYFDGVDYFDFQAAFDAVTPEDVMQVLRTCFVPERTSISVIEPRKESL